MSKYEFIHKASNGTTKLSFLALSDKEAWNELIKLVGFDKCNDWEYVNSNIIR